MTKFKILRVRKNCPVPVCWNGFSQTDPKLEKMHGACLSDYWQLNHGDEYYSAYDEVDWEGAAEVVARKIILDRKYVLNLYKKQKKFGKKLAVLSKKIRTTNLGEFSKLKLISIYRKIELAWVNYDQTNVYPWFLGGDAFQENLRKLLLEVRIPDKKIENLLTSPELSFSAKEELEIFKAASRVIDSLQLLGEKARELSEKYYWIPFGYDGPNVNDAEYYRKEIKAIIETKTRLEIRRRITKLGEYRATMLAKHETIRRDFGIKNDLRKLIGISHTLAYMTDERKRYAYQAHEAFYRVVLALAKKIGVDYKVLKFVMRSELEENLNKPNILKKLAEKRMTGWLIIHWPKGKCELIEGIKAKKIAENMLFVSRSGNVIQGAVGSRGKGSVRGWVRIIWGPSENSKLQEGEILVTGMTTPQFAPAMRKAAAIITDEGGVTCHAAIVSRELGKLCIIGTKIATRVLKDGDLVEVDADKGVVKIIKKATRGR